MHQRIQKIYFEWRKLGKNKIENHAGVVDRARKQKKPFHRELLSSIFTNKQQKMRTSLQAHPQYESNPG